MSVTSSIALIGGETLLGKEMREVFESQALPAEVRLIAGAAEQSNILSEERGELAAILPLQSADISAAKVIVFADSPETSRTAYDLLQKQTSTAIYIDASRGLEDDPNARLCAPMAGKSCVEPDHIQVIAHPAAIALALFLRRLQRSNAIRSSVALIFEPASEQGQRGLDELQQQTVGLLNLHKLKKDVYDAQVSFNMLPRYGEDARRSLEDIELTIDRHLATLLSTNHVPLPSLRLVQAPVFHAYSISLWVEFEQTPDVDSIAASLATAQIEVRSKDLDPLTNVGVAGQSGIGVGEISVDRNNPRACWFWIVADNLRITAENAVEVARELLG